MSNPFYLKLFLTLFQLINLLKNTICFMRKILFLVLILAVAMGFSSCWMEAKGKRHKVEVGAHRVSNDDNKSKK